MCNNMQKFPSLSIETVHVGCEMRMDKKYEEENIMIKATVKLAAWLFFNAIFDWPY